MWAGHCLLRAPCEVGLGSGQACGGWGWGRGASLASASPSPFSPASSQDQVGSMPGPASGLSAPALTWFALTQTPLSSRSSHRRLLDDPEFIHVCFVPIPQTSKLRL